MNNHDHDPHQLSRKHARRAKVASVMSGLIPFSTLSAFEAFSAQPAAAAPEAVRQAEQSPQSFMDGIDKRLADEAKRMRSSPYFSSVDAHKIFKTMPLGSTFEYVGVPSKQYPGHYDWLAVTRLKGESVPINLSINLGAVSKTYGGMMGVYKSGYTFSQRSDSFKIKPKSMLLETDTTPVSYSTMHYFAVSSDGYPAGSVMPHHPATRYSNDPAQVKAEFNAFLNQVHSITTHR
jgi:hypothetical protein